MLPCDVSRNSIGQTQSPNMRNVTSSCYTFRYSDKNARKAESRNWIERKLEARVGIEPTYKGFADLSLTTWVPRLNQLEN